MRINKQIFVRNLVFVHLIKIISFLIVFSFFGCQSVKNSLYLSKDFVSSTDENIQIGYITGDINLSDFNDYFGKIYEAIAKRWTLESANYNIDDIDHNARVIVTIILTNEGNLDGVKVNLNGGDEKASNLCKDAIRSSVPFPKWPNKMVNKLGKRTEVKITFIYR